MKKLMPSEGLRLGCSSGSTRCVIAKNYVLGQPGGGDLLTCQLIITKTLYLYERYYRRNGRGFVGLPA